SATPPARPKRRLKLALPSPRALGYSAARLALGASRPFHGRTGRRAPRRAGVAKQWRIRHKLMLGLALAVSVLALVLGGAVRGLWAYWVTNNTVKDLHKELRAAEDFNEAVAKFVTPDWLKALANYPSLVNEAVDEARRKLDQYEDALKEGLAQRYDP